MQCYLLGPHYLSKPLLFFLAAKDDVDAFSGEVAYLPTAQAKVFGHQGVFVGQWAAKDAHVVGLSMLSVSGSISSSFCSKTYT